MTLQELVDIINDEKKYTDKKVNLQFLINVEQGLDVLDRSSIFKYLNRYDTYILRNGKKMKKSVIKKSIMLLYRFARMNEQGYNVTVLPMYGVRAIRMY